MRKIIFALVLVLSFSVSASAELKIGFFEQLNSTPEEFQSSSLSYSIHHMSLLSKGHEGGYKCLFFDDLSTQLMALEAGVIDEVDMPAVSAVYVLNTCGGKYNLTCYEYSTTPMYLSMGFLKSNPNGETLREKFDSAIKSMKADGTLSNLILTYVIEPDLNELKSVTFEKFDGADEIKIAVTGDYPPLDYIRADGTAAGFNTAVLAEIGKRLKMNIKLVNINTASRTSALTSGRADVVFMYLIAEGVDKQRDAPEGILLSEPYYKFFEFMHIGLSREEK